MERLHGRDAVVSRLRKVQRHRHHVRRLEARLDRAQVHEASREESRADQQHEREGHFRDDESVSKAKRASGRRRRAFAQRTRDVTANGLQRRHDPEQESGNQGNRQRDRHHPEIDPDLGVARQCPRRHELQQERRGEYRHQRGCQPAGD